VRNGDRIALRSSLGYFLSAELGGGGAVNMNRTTIGSWETFQLKRQK
jgi:hypothetical protein